MTWSSSESVCAYLLGVSLQEETFPPIILMASSLVRVCNNLQYYVLEIFNIARHIITFTIFHWKSMLHNNILHTHARSRDFRVFICHNLISLFTVVRLRGVFFNLHCTKRMRLSMIRRFSKPWIPLVAGAFLSGGISSCMLECLFVCCQFDLSV